MGEYTCVGLKENLPPKSGSHLSMEYKLNRLQTKTMGNMEYGE